jgi:hypothetical protein
MSRGLRERPQFFADEVIEHSSHQTGA